MAICGANASMGHHGRVNYCGNLLWQYILDPVVPRLTLEIKTVRDNIVIALEEAKCKVEDLYFLHLSDLHIATSLNRTLYKLIDDIAIQLRNVRSLVIIVTGDLACTGKVADSTDLIVFFFECLRDKIPGSCRVLDVVITPGNHDVIRPEDMPGFNGGSYRYDSKEYEVLEKRIMRIFADGTQTKIRRSRNHTTGIEVLEYGIHTICIINVDSSWFATRDELNQRIKGKSKNKKSTLTRKQQKIVDNIIDNVLKATKAQNRYLRLEYNKLQQEYKKFDLTIVVSHYPITWMVRNVEQTLHDFLANAGLPPVDIWMCGHSHDTQMYFNTENNQSTTMLMTGIGRPDYENHLKRTKGHNSNERFQLQRYSIYQISFERNVCSVQVRVSKRGGLFDRDGEFYKSENTRKYNYLCLPLKTEVPGGFIRLNSLADEDSKGLYVDYSTLSGIEEIGQRTVVFSERMREEFNFLLDFLLQVIVANGRYKQEYIAKRFLACYSLPGHIGSERLKCECLRTIIDFGLFKEYLFYLASNIIESFTGDLVELPDDSEYTKDVAFTAIGWRVHFRKYQGHMSLDKCVILNDEYVGIVSAGASGKVKVLPWGGLLQGAMKHNNKCLIRSAANIPNHIPTGWSDFLTAIPIFDGNCRTMQLSDGTKVVRPILTFAISMRIRSYEQSVVASKILYMMEFFRINFVISRIIQSFFQFFGFAGSEIDRVLENL